MANDEGTPAAPAPEHPRSLPPTDEARIAGLLETISHLGRLDEFDLAVFVSPNAAHHALDAIGARRALPATLVRRGGARPQ